MDCLHAPMRSLKIAMVGLKPPAKWGGIEKFVEKSAVASSNVAIR